jgi:ABC-type dipeptide/oligopeptide/nickel transport system permease component
MGLHRPIVVQYFGFLAQLVHGDLGYSYVLSAPVADTILQNYRYTVQLAVGGLVIALVIGLPAGLLAAVRRNTVWDLLTMSTAFVPLSAPAFWVGLVLLLTFSIRWQLFPLIGAGDPRSAMDTLRHLVLPAFTVGASFAAVLARFVRSAMLNVLHEDYIRTARAKGLRHVRIVHRHALRNALIPVVTLLGLDLIVLLSGSVVTETVFSRPGIGRLLVEAVLSRDYAMLQGVVLAIAVFVVLINATIDICYALVDPRVRYE